MEPASSPDDAALVRGTLAGRREDFDLLVQRHQKALYRFVFRIVRHHATAADIMQMSFLEAYRNLARFAGRSRFKTWLYQIALNQCRSLHRSRRRGREVGLDEVREVDLSDAHPAHESSVSGWRATLQPLLSRLPARQREVVTLRLFADLPFKDIAQAEGITENAAKVSYHHAIVRLRRWIKDGAS